MLNFQTDYDEATGEQVLTCFLLPQMDYQVEQGEYFFLDNYITWVVPLICSRHFQDDFCRVQRPLVLDKNTNLAKSWREKSGTTHGI
mgnify:CR=1 FL=1